jgi:hypothetical protein
LPSSFKGLPQDSLPLDHENADIMFVALDVQTIFSGKFVSLLRWILSYRFMAAARHFPARAKMKSRTIAIINSSSGSPADNNANRLRDVLQARELSWEIWPARDGLELCSLAQKAAAGDASIVVAGLL